MDHPTIGDVKRAQKVLVAMQDGVLNLCRVKLRDQQRLAHGPLTEYPQYPDGGAAERTHRPHPNPLPRSGRGSPI